MVVVSAVVFPVGLSNSPGGRFVALQLFETLSLLFLCKPEEEFDYKIAVVRQL